MLRFVVVVGLVLALDVPAVATTHLVRPDGTGEYPDIATAILQTAEGDTILLANGVFRGANNRDLDCEGKSLVIRSESGSPDACGIDCESSGRAFHFWRQERQDCVVEGIAIVNGWMDAKGGAILCEAGSEPTIRNCRFSDNGTQGCSTWGGALAAESCSLYVADCEFYHNRVIGGSGGAANSEHGAQIVFERCLFVENSAIEGGAIEVSYDSAVKLMGCTLVGNSGAMGGAICCWGNSSVQVANCTLVRNVADDASAICVPAGTEFGHCPVEVTRSIFTQGSSRPIFCGPTSTFTVSCTDIYGNTGGDWSSCTTYMIGVDGNFSDDPLFCRYEYAIRSDSPCAPQHNPECGLIGAWPVGCYGPAGVDGGGDRPTEGELALGNAGPNPFRDRTRISYVVPSGMEGIPVTLGVYDASGRLVRRLVDAAGSPGAHEVTWDGIGAIGERVPPGVYFYQLDAGGRSAQKRIVLLH